MQEPRKIGFHLDTGKSFALIEKNGLVSVYQGDVFELPAIADIHTLSRDSNADVIFALPYRAIQEKDCQALGDEPILAMRVTSSLMIPVNDMIRQLPSSPCRINGTVYPSMDDESFSAMVEKFQQNAIEKGLCSQATLSRKFSGTIRDLDIDVILTLYKNLLGQPGHYMTVLFAHIDPADPGKTHYILAGTPERHLEISGNETLMCPIAGTCRKDDLETFPARLNDFLNDKKEIHELFQVLDEEMKMMGVICPKGGTILGPYLREVGMVVHTEYVLSGRRSTHSIDALRATLHAPTVVGSPLISAARLISQYETESRRYYAGEFGIYRQPKSDVPDGDLDCAILIRGAEIFANGDFHIQAGAGIVRDSNPASEALETKAKAMGILNVLTGQSSPRRILTEDILHATHDRLVSRNRALSSFWQSDQAAYLNRDYPFSFDPASKKITIINNEDDFSLMIMHILRALGFADTSMVDTFAFDPVTDRSALVILGPGPGNPVDMDDRRMKALQDIIAAIKNHHKPLLGICLGHQALAYAHGFPVTRQSASTQGTPRTLTVQGQNKTLGFYNSFSPTMPPDPAPLPDGITVDMDDHGRIIALYSAAMIGFQFHPESVMSIDGIPLLHRALEKLLSSAG